MIDRWQRARHLVVGGRDVQNTVRTMKDVVVVRQGKGENVCCVRCVCGGMEWKKGVGGSIYARSPGFHMLDCRLVKGNHIA